MSLYINPSSMTKEEFLSHFGAEFSISDIDEVCSWDPLDKSERCVVSLVQNLSFSAAGIIEDQRDLDRWAEHSRMRGQRWFVVQTADINKFGNVGVQL